MKKFLIMLLCVAVAICALVLVACDKQEHAFGEWIEAAPATCSQAGAVGHYHCDHCNKNFDKDGNEIADITVAALGHDWHDEVTKPATCTSTGVKTRTCTRCDIAPQEETLPMIPHSYGEWAAVAEPTCQKEGSVRRVCEVCDAEDVEAVEKLQHTFGEWEHTVLPSCTSTGIDTRSCTTCDKSIAPVVTETRTVDMLPHTFADDGWVMLSEPTCTTQGTEINTCTVCKTASSTRLTDKLDHTRVKVDGTPATCTEAGLTDGEQCSVCGAVLTGQTTIPALGHTNNWTYSKVGATRDHEFHTKTCDRPGCKGVVEQCAITVTNTRESCDEEGTTTRTCEHCGYTDTQTLAAGQHSWDGGLVTKAATCNSDGEITYKCTLCDDGEKKEAITQRPAHTLAAEWTTSDDKHYKECIVCHTHLQEDTHTPSDWIVDKAATCTEAGSQHTQCTVCLKQLETDEIAITEHNMFLSEKKDATCTEAGYTVQKCATCTYEIRLETQSALGHQYGAWQQFVADEENPDHQHYHYRDCTRCTDPSVRQQSECDLQLDGTVKATCTTPGFDRLVCSECQSVHERITQDATGHNLVYTQTRKGLFQARHKAECTNPDCDYSLEDDCVIVAEQIAATCTTNRYTNYKCAVCEKGFKIPEEGTALGHIFSAPQFCGSKEHPQHKVVCTRDNCGYEIITDCEMVSTETLPTCDEAGVVTTACKDCFQSFSEAGAASAGHSWTPWRLLDDGQHVQTCSNCGKQEFGSHEYQVISQKEADCEHLGEKVEQCKQCKNERREQWGELKKHQWVLESMSPAAHKAKCAVCNTVSENGHEWIESNLCSVCGYDGLEYTISGAHCTVKSAKKVPNAQNIIIPEKHKVLRDDGTYENTEYTVEKIGHSAFSAHKMRTLSFPCTVKTIEEMAFYYCTELQKVTVTGDAHQLTTIERYAFSRCTSLQTFDPPATLTTLGDYAFAESTSLVNIEIGDELTDIGKGAFLNTGYVNNDEHWQNDMLYLGLHLIKVRDGSQSTVEVKSGTLSISSAAFTGTTTVSKVILPSSLKLVDADAFKDCTTLTEVEFKGKAAEWFNINFVNDFSSPLHYGSPVFHIDGAVGVVSIPDHVTRIPAGTFRGTAITEIVIPENVTYIGEEAFENCLQLRTITVNSDKISYIGKDAFKGSAYYADASNWHNDNTVLYVGKYLIEARDELSGSYTVEDGTITIANNAFQGCKGLTAITLDADLQYVGEYAFDQCDGLKTIKFTETGYRWYMTSDTISRVLMVTDTNFTSYKLYNRGWRRYIPV